MSGPCGRTSVPIIREVEGISTVNMVKTIKKIYFKYSFEYNVKNLIDSGDVYILDLEMLK